MSDILLASALPAPRSQRPSHPFEVRSRDIFRIAVPASIAFITEPLVGIVDTTVIGRLGDAKLLGGVVLGALAFDTLFSLAYFLRVGTAGLTAQATGARDPKDALIEVVRAILVAVVLGLLLIALTWPLLETYLLILAPGPGVNTAFSAYFDIRIRAAPFSLVNYALLGWFYGRANARTGMALQILIHSVNIALNIWFVLGLGWGVQGAALGTVLGEASATITGLCLLVRHFGGLRPLLALLTRQELLDGHALRRMFGLSRDITIRTVALMASYAYFAAQGSRAGDIVLSGNAILMNFLMVSSFFLDGLAQASEQLCGKAVGANWQPAFDKACRLSLAWGVVIGFVIGGAWLVGGPALIDLMTTNAAIEAHARTYLPMVALAAITGMPAFVFDGVLAGSTMTRVMRNGMLVALAFFLAAAFVLQPSFGNWALWLALHAFFLARAGIFYIGMERGKPYLFG